MQFRDQTDRTGIVELLEDLTNTQSASSSSYPLATKTRDINNAFANYNMIAQKSAGKWEADDTNQVDYPIITTDLVAGQQDYSFTVDEQGNQILDIYRVELANADGIFTELVPLDEIDMKGVSLTEFMKTSGTAIYYRKTANGIFLYAPTDYNYTDGLKIYYARTPVYFTTSDTTKKPGIPDMFHEYLAMRPAYFYALRTGQPTAQAYGQEMLAIEDRIGDYYANRSRDMKTQVRTIYRSPR